MGETGGHQQRSDALRDPMRTDMRRVAAFDKPVRALRRIAREPLVARLPTDAVPSTELPHAVEPAVVIREELRTLLHRGHLLPGHGRLAKGLPRR